MGYGIAFFGGLVVLFIAVILLLDRISFLKRGTVAVAKVTGYHIEEDGDGDKTYKPVFTFTHENKNIVHLDLFSSGSMDWSIGEEVKVVYNYNNPDKAVVLTYFRAFGIIIVLTAIALVMLLIGGGYYIAQHYINKF